MFLSLYSSKVKKKLIENYPQIMGTEIKAKVSEIKYC